jgi:hypothetical protein
MFRHFPVTIRQFTITNKHTINTVTVYITTVCLCNLYCYMFRHFPVTITQFTITNKHTINTITVYITTVRLCNLYCYMFRHFPVTIRQLTTEALLSYTRSANAAVDNSFSSPSHDRSKTSSKSSSPRSAIQSLLLQMRVSSPFLKVIQ